MCASPTQIEMSVFDDFQKAWAAKFPGCVLPQAWEEDVRANLAKHRHKVAVLKEELEKEEFYVEYLERLLADVENHKRNNSVKMMKSMKTVENGSQNGDETNDDNDTKQDIKKIDASDDCNGVSKREIENTVEDLPLDTGDTDVNKSISSSEPTNNKGSPYVTVIRVNGYSAENSAAEAEAESESSPDSSLRSEKVSSKGKVPPKPPPKKPRRSPSGTSLNDVPSDSNSTPDDSKSSLGKDFSLNGSVNSLHLRDISEESCKIDAEEAEMKNERVDRDNEKDRDSRIPTNNGEELGENIDYDNGTIKSATSAYSGYSSHSGVSDGAVSSPMPDSDGSKYSDYVNIDFFLRRKARLEQSTSDMNADDSEDDENENTCLLVSLTSDAEEDAVKNGHDRNSNVHQPDDVFEMDSGVYSSSLDSTSFAPSSTSTPPTPPACKKTNSTSTPSSIPEETKEIVDLNATKLEAERIAMYRCIISSILESETVYLECLTVLLQYMKALRSTIGTSQPVMSQEDFNVIFFKISELQTLHGTFLEGIKNRTQNWDGKLTFGDHFKILASKLGVYAAFLQNYPRAIETVRKCCMENLQFSEITKAIKLRTLKGQALSLENLLHKPVARVQKNALVLHDLLKYTPKSHPDHATLKTALKLTQCFLNEFNSTAAGNLFPVQDRNQRHLVKNTFIVELSEGHRKLRHLFLFNDVIVCAKYKVSGREKFTFEVKWYMPLPEVILPQNEDCKEIREISPVNILSLKTQASTARDQVMKEEKNKVTSRNMDKQKKKLAELEAQLVLASPNLTFRISHKSGKTFVFFLSSEYERTQWVDAITTLQVSAPAVNPSLNLPELQTWITACRTFLKTNMGSFLLRSPGRDHLLVGDLHVNIDSLQGLSRPADILLCIEVDCYGHFFRKAKTKVCRNSTEPVWNQNFVIELEGSQSLRLLCYEQQAQGTVLRAKTTLELNRQWLTSQVQEKTVTLQEFLLTMSIKFTPGEMTLRRAPSAKPFGLFGIKINQVCKREKRPIPFVITSCAREVERRGMSEVGVYRVSGSTSDVQKLKKAFESNAYEAEQLLKEVDVHSVTGLLKMYLRELPEALYTDELYPSFLDGFGLPDPEHRKMRLLELFNLLPEVNQSIIIFLLNHMIKLNKQETFNKMSLHNLATVFGPTLLRPGTKCDVSSPSDLLAAETIDVMAQAGILYFFMKRYANGETIQNNAKVNNEEL
uniref:Active breakpoint cluster region-related protein n=1 Tax=Strigamia maritima TaxID=126957 RepID=T1J2N9_STRMM